MLLAVLAAAPPLANRAHAQTPAAQPRPSAPAIIIVDGSGSMWGNLGQDRASKFDLVRAALRQALTPLGPQSRIGLMSFGQRRRADCSDVEVVTPPDVGPGERIAGLADKLNPRGKGPVALAIREAAKQVPAGTAATVILMHDGPDNCQQDPCAAAAEVAKANPKIVIDVIALGLEKADAQRMACVPKATKGQMFDVRDAAGLNVAVAESVRLASPDPAAGRPAAEAGLTAPAPTEAPGLRLSAALAGVGPTLTVPVTWRVTKAEAPNDLVAKRESPELNLNVAPGSYVVEASLGLAKARQVVEVGSKGRTSAQLGLAAGILKINGHADKDGDALAEPIVTVSAIADGGGTTRAPETPVWITREPSTELVLPAGTYKVRIEDGLANKEMQVAVTPGNAVEAQMVLGTGRLELSAAANGGAEAMTDVVYTLEEDDPDAPQGRREVARSAEPAPVFILPAGTYYLSARSGAAEVRDRIAVGSGATVKHLLTFNAVRLSVAVQVDGVVSGQQPITVRVFTSEQGSEEIARSTAEAPVFFLPPRRYRVEAQLGTENVKAQTEVDVPAGRDTKISFKLPSAELTVMPRTGSPASGAPWQVKDNKGETVLHSGAGGQRTARLAPGHYVVQTQDQNRLQEQALELKSGERRTLEITPQ
jgi:Ca-activated chloride channel family protein